MAEEEHEVADMHDSTPPLVRKTPWRFAIVAIVLIGIGIGCCAFLGIWTSAEIEAYRGMASECHPVWKQFALRRFRAGGSAADLIREFPPSEREEFGRYGVYLYYQIPGHAGLDVVTGDGKLLSADAYSCTWLFQFFWSDDANIARRKVREAERNRPGSKWFKKKK